MIAYKKIPIMFLFLWSCKMDKADPLTDCPANTNLDSGQCISNTRKCRIPNGQGTQNYDTSKESWGLCTHSSCNANFHKELEGCVSDTRTCSVPNGQGTQSYDTSKESWGICTHSSCNANFRKESGGCVADTVDPHLADLKPSVAHGPIGTEDQTTPNKTPLFSWTITGGDQSLISGFELLVREAELDQLILDWHLIADSNLRSLQFENGKNDISFSKLLVLQKEYNTSIRIVYTDGTKSKEKILNWRYRINLTAETVNSWRSNGARGVNRNIVVVFSKEYTDEIVQFMMAELFDGPQSMLALYPYSKYSNYNIDYQKSSHSFLDPWFIVPEYYDMRLAFTSQTRGLADDQFAMTGSYYALNETNPSLNETSRPALSGTIRIMIHEAAHHFAQLDDEYTHQGDTADGLNCQVNKNNWSGIDGYTGKTYSDPCTPQQLSGTRYVTYGTTGATAQSIMTYYWDAYTYSNQSWSHLFGPINSYYILRRLIQKPTDLNHRVLKNFQMMSSSRFQIELDSIYDVDHVTFSVPALSLSNIRMGQSSVYLERFTYTFTNINHVNGSYDITFKSVDGSQVSSTITSDIFPKINISNNFLIYNWANWSFSSEVVDENTVNTLSKQGLVNIADRSIVKGFSDPLCLYEDGRGTVESGNVSLSIDLNEGVAIGAEIFRNIYVKIADEDGGDISTCKNLDKMINIYTNTEFTPDFN